MPYFDSLDVLEGLYNKFQAEKGALGLANVAYADEEISPLYPSLILVPGVLSRDIEQTHKFHVRFAFEIYILHANLTQTKRQRSKADLEFMRKVVDSLHADMTLGGNVINGFVISESPGQINRARGPAVVSTRLVWTAQGRAPFKRG